MPLGTQNTSPVISALGSPGPVRAPSLGVGGWCDSGDVVVGGGGGAGGGGRDDNDHDAGYDDW